MKSIYLLFGILFVGLGAISISAQCCCSNVSIKLIEGSGLPLISRDVKVSEISRSVVENRVSFTENDNGETHLKFHIGCGTGSEVLLIDYAGAQMHLRLKLHGDFGFAEGELIFVAGNYVAEFSKQQEEGVRKAIAFREATADEVKEMKSFEAEDAPIDQTANHL
ncbi:MAG: hypothetical protein ACRD6X_04635 [Pyrinomonadaceae bacterium]